MTESPRVSVITPTYNRADFIGQAVQSVLVQDYTDFELLIVDDGSTDNTEAILQPFLKDSRIHYSKQANQGQSLARNNALAQARGEFICFLDSDNAWVPGKLSMQIAYLDSNPNVDVVYGDNIFINEAGEETSRENMTRHSGFIAYPMLKDNCVAMNTTMARRRCFDEMGGMSGTRRVADDYDLWLRFSARFRFHYMAEYLAYYRVMEQQISSDKTARFDSNEAIIHDFRRQFPDVLPRKRFDEAFAFFYMRKARFLAAAGQRRQAWCEILRALGYRPFSRVVWRAVAAIAFKRS